MKQPTANRKQKGFKKCLSTLDNRPFFWNTWQSQPEIPMEIPETVIRDLLKGKGQVQFKFLALNILLARIKMEVRKDPNLLNIKEYTREFTELLQKHERLPDVKHDIALILGK